MTIDDSTAVPGLGPTAALSAADRESARLRRAAGDFEAAMLTTLLKEMRATTPGEGMDAAGSGVLDAMGSEALAGALAKRGGMGIAEALVRAMEPQARALAADHAKEGLVG